MFHSHTRDYGLFASLLGASERTLHHFILYLGTTRTLLTACKLHRGVRAPPKEARAVALLCCCPTQLMCMCVCSRRHHYTGDDAHTQPGGRSCTGAGGPEPTMLTPGSCLHPDLGRI